MTILLSHQASKRKSHNKGSQLCYAKFRQILDCDTIIFVTMFCYNPQRSVGGGTLKIPSWEKLRK